MKFKKILVALLSIAVVMNLFTIASFASGDTERYQLSTGDESVLLAMSYKNDDIYVLTDVNGSATKVPTIGNSIYSTTKGTALKIELVYGNFIVYARVNNRAYRTTAYHYKVSGKYLVPNALSGFNMVDSDPGYWATIGSKLVYRQSETNSTDATDEKVVIVETNDSTPVFKAVDSADYSSDFYNGENYYGMTIGSFACTHPNWVHHAEVPTTCISDGVAEYWTCSDCDNIFDDEFGTNQVYDLSELKTVAYGARDNNHDGICDECGKSMPVFEKITSKSEVMPGNKYIAVSKYNGRYYALGIPSIKSSFEHYDSLPVKQITPNEDGTIAFMEAYDNNSMIILLNYIYDNASWEDGGMRFGFHFTKNDRQYLLSYNFEISKEKYAKYGYHITQNGDRLVISDAYTEEWTEDDLHLRMIHNSNGLSFSMNKEEDDTAYRVDLYRLVECGTHGKTRYVLRDGTPNVDYDKLEGADENAIGICCVSGIAGALSQNAINNLVEQIADENDNEINICTKMNIELKAVDEDCMTFDLNPIAYKQGDEGNALSISDEAFKGDKMTVTLYTGGLMPVTIVHYKTDGTKEIFYQPYSGKNKEFSTGFDNNGNSYVEFDVTEFSQVKLLNYDESAPAYNIDFFGLYDSNGSYIDSVPLNEAFTVKTTVQLYNTNKETANNVYIAVFDTNGKLLYVDIAQNTCEELVFQIPAISGANKIKALVLDNNLAPVADSFTKE